MANRQKVSSLSGQVEYDLAGNQKVSSLSGQVEYDLAGQQKVSHLSAQVEYDLDVWGSDPSLVAAYRFESSPGLLIDSSGNGHTLTASASAPTADASDYREGAQSALYTRASSQYHYRTDANLKTGFPLKSGDTNREGSFLLWFKLNSLAAGTVYGLLSKYTTNAGFEIEAIGTQTIRIRFIEAAGIHNYDISGIQTGRWYHLAVAFNAVDKRCIIRLWDNTAAAFSHTNSFQTNYGAAANAGDLRIGRDTAVSTYYLDGKLDQVLIFNRILGPTEMDAIRAAANQDETMDVAGGAVSGGAVVPVFIRISLSPAGGVVLGGVVSTHRVSGKAIAGGCVAGGSVVPSFVSAPAVAGGAISGGAITGTWVDAGPLVYTVPVAGGVVAGGAVDTSSLSVQVVSKTASGGAVLGGAVDTTRLSVLPAGGGVVAGGSPSFSRILKTNTPVGGSVAGGDSYEYWIDGLPDDLLWDADNIRQVIKANKNGKSIRIRLTGSTVKAVTLIGASIGPRSGTTGNYSAAPTRLTFNGGDDGVVIPRNGYVWTDWLTYTVVKNTNYLLHLAFLLGTNWLVTGNKGTINAYYKMAGDDDTLTETLVGYSTSTKVTAVTTFSIVTPVTRTATARRGAVAGGTAIPKRMRVEPVAGGMVGGGVAVWSSVLDNLQSLIVLPDGGAVAGGSSDHVKISTNLGAGGVVLGGQPEFRSIPVSTTVGGIVAGGSATVIQIADFLPGGGAVLGGAVTTTTVLVQVVSRSADGGAVGGGSANENVLLIAGIPVGGVVLGGTGTVTYSVSIPVSGGAVAGGAQVPKYAFQGLVSGGGVGGGSASSTKLNLFYCSSGVVIGGDSPWYGTLVVYIEGGKIEFEGSVARVNFIGSMPVVDFAASYGRTRFEGLVVEVEFVGNTARIKAR